jgi:hypothetical protein
LTLTMRSGKKKNRDKRFAPRSLNHLFKNGCWFKPRQRRATDLISCSVSHCGIYHICEHKTTIITYISKIKPGIRRSCNEKLRAVAFIILESSSCTRFAPRGRERCASKCMLSVRRQPVHCSISGFRAKTTRQKNVCRVLRDTNMSSTKSPAKMLSPHQPSVLNICARV